MQSPVTTRWGGFVVSGAAVALVLVTAGAEAVVSAATPVTIVQHGQLPVPPTGTFTAPPPLCPAGAWSDKRSRTTGKTFFAFRMHTCADGSGTIEMPTQGDDARLGDGSGTWRITGGTGAYANLRGKGTWTGKTETPQTFTDTLTGVVDFDTVAPTGSVTSTATRLRRPARAVRLRMRLQGADDQAGNAVTYMLAVVASAGSSLARVSGTLPAGGVTVTRVVRPSRTAKRLIVELTLGDPVGNERVTRKTVRLPQ